MQRVLDVDLDFFLNGVANDVDPESTERLGAREYAPWPRNETLSFFVDRCGLDASLPGFAVDNHGEVFGKWRTLIDAGRLQPPFHVTHVDAHGDLSMSEIGYKHILTELVHLRLNDRPTAAAARVGDGDYLAHAIGCRWLSELDYVYNGGATFTPTSGRTSRSPARPSGWPRSPKDDIKALFDLQTPTVVYGEPRVPPSQIRWDAYRSSAPFDLIFLARSRPFTPAEADPLYEAIRGRFIDDSAPT